MIPAIEAAGEAIAPAAEAGTMQAAGGALSGGGMPSPSSTGGLLSNLSNPNNYGLTQQNEAQTVIPQPQVAGQTLQGIQDLQGQTQAANLGIKQAGLQAAPVQTETGGLLQDAGIRPLNVGSNLASASLDNYKASIQQISNKTIDTENALTNMNQSAQINPNQYMQNLGVSGRLIASLGMLVSGAGAGLTGQPNLAMQVVQKNIDRDIASQQQNFLNQGQIYASQKGLLQSAQDRSQLSTQALLAATMSVTSGASTYLQGTAQKVAGIQDQNMYQQLIQQNQMKYNQALNQYNQLFGYVVKSGNSKNTNLYGAGIDGIHDVLTGQKGKGLIEIPNAINQIQESQGNNPAAQPSTEAPVQKRTFLQQMAEQE